MTETNGVHQAEMIDHLWKHSMFARLWRVLIS